MGGGTGDVGGCRGRNGLPRGWDASRGGAPGAGAAHEMAELKLPREEDYPVLALDPTSDPPLLWYSEGLWRIEDRGRKLVISRKIVS